jgi:hypothetical protein
MVPYLKGLHLTINSWWPHRDADGWRMVNETAVEGKGEVDVKDAPEFVQAVLRFVYDLEALEVLTETDCPPCIKVRPVAMACTGFTFGDMCGVGFGQSLWLLGANNINVFYGLWGDDASANSSNWKEFYNQVMGVEQGLKKGTIP